MKNDRASETAALIARGITLAAATPALRPMVIADSAEWSRRLLAAAGQTRPWLETAPARAALFGLERLLLPGVLLHWLARKRRLDELARDAISAGCSQIVVLGAGFDTLAWRLRDRAATFELDHPATQAVKRQVFPDGLTFGRVDFANESVRDPLAALPAFDRGQPTLFVAEGLLMYLEPTRVASLLSELSALSAVGSRCAFSFMEAQPGKPLAFHQASPLVDAWLRWRGEPFRWGLARSAAEAFVAAHGWRLDSLSSPEEQRRRFLTPCGLDHRPMATGETIAYLCIA